jgi:hypothetical protein
MFEVVGFIVCFIILAWCIRGAIIRENYLESRDQEIENRISNLEKKLANKEVGE